MKVFKTSVVFLLAFFSIHLFTVNVNAHKNDESKWFYINGEFNLVDNSNPNPSSLLWSDHILPGNFSVNEEIVMEARRDDLPESSKLPNSLISYRIKHEYDFNVEDNGELVKSIKSEGIYVIDIIKDSVSLTFNKSGNYQFSVLVENQNNEVLEREDFTMIIGEPVEPAELVVNDLLINFKNRNQIIKRSDVVTFEVNNPDFDKFNYYLDLGGGDFIIINDQPEKIVKRGFLSEKMPLYVILRSEDKESKVSDDSYVRLFTDEEELYKVLPPSVNVPETTNNLNNWIFPIVLVLLMIPSSIVTFLLVRKYKRA